MRDSAVVTPITLTVIILALLLAGCNKQPSGKVSITGDKLTLPPTCRIERYNASTKLKPKYVFTRFDGKYPEHWPKGLTLPPDYYLLHAPLQMRDAKNQESQEHGGRLFDLDGVVHMPFKDTVEYFRRAGRIANLEVGSDEFHDTLKIALDVGMKNKDQIEHQLLEWGRGKHRLSFHGEQLGNYPVVILDIYSDRDMGGYTFIRGSVAVYLPEGDLYK